MIDINNHRFMSDAERRNVLFRAIHTQPFFNMMDFPVQVETLKRDQWGAKIQVNKDFYMTEIVGNFDEAFAATGSLFNLSAYATLNQGSLYKFSQSINLPSGLVAGEARSALVSFAGQKFDDRQNEYCPYLIKSGDEVQGRVANTQDKSEAFDIKLMLKGYYVYPTAHLSENTTRGINESLSEPIRYELWKQDIQVDANLRRKAYSFRNDRKARIVLGFGVIDHNSSGRPSVLTIEIIDSFRNIQWTNVPIPIEFFAPRTGDASGGVRDAHIYYLPTEYLLQPFSALQCTVNTTDVEDNCQLVMLTRTV